MSLRRLCLDARGAAAAEMALVVPFLLMIMLGAAELGRYFYHEHVLVKAVRDGAVFAARAPIDRFNCTSGAVDNGIVTNTRSLVRTGALSGGTDLLPWWTEAGVSFTMTVECETEAGGETMAGIYTDNAGKAPVVTIIAILPYEPIFGTLGLGGSNFNLQAHQQTAVLGI